MTGQADNPDNKIWARRLVYSAGIVKAAYEGDFDEVKHILNEEPTVVNSTNEFDAQAGTALHAAAGMGHLDIVQFLLAHGARVDIGDSSGATPLHYAAFNGRLEIVGVLLDHGADVDARLSDSTQVVDVACEKSRDNGVYPLLVLARVMRKDRITLPAGYGFVDVAKAAIALGRQKGSANVTKEDIDAALKTFLRRTSISRPSTRAESPKAHETGFASTHCSSCGTQLPDDANFCLRCGKPLGLNPPGPRSIERWEYHTETLLLNIKVVGAGWAIEGGMSIDQSTEQKINALIDSQVEALGKEGWLPVQQHDFKALSRAGCLKFKDVSPFLKWGSGSDYLLQSISFKLKRPMR